MYERLDADVVVAGGGIAGLILAIMLGKQDFSVVMVEPTLHGGHRLGGEVLQPRGVHALTQLGLIDAAYSHGATPLAGFHTWCKEGDVQICYESPQFGITVEHEALRTALLHAAKQTPNVHVLTGRVTSHAERSTCIDVHVDASHTAEARIRAMLLVGADGARSRIRSMAGIACKFSAVSRLNILTIPASLLPDTQSAHCFVGQGTIGFAYALSGGKARLMVDHCQAVSRSAREVVAWLPANVHDGFRQSTTIVPDNLGVHHYVTALAVVNRPYRGRVALIGDAAGTCHPITASGMTSAILDAQELALALAGSRSDPARGLARYAHRCHGRHASRQVFANALYEIYTSREPECALLRQAMILDCRHRSGASSGANLLAMTHSHPALLAHGMLSILLCGLKELCVSAAYPGWRARLRMGGSITRRMLRYGAALLRDPWRFSMLARHSMTDGATASPAHG